MAVEPVPSAGLLHSTPASDEGTFAMGPVPSIRCFRHVRTEGLSFYELVYLLLTMPGIPEGRPDLATLSSPDADDIASAVRAAENTLLSRMAMPPDGDTARLVASKFSGSEESRRRALCITLYTLENPVPVYRRLNAWLNATRRDPSVKQHIGPFFVEFYRGLLSLPLKTVRASRAIKVHDKTHLMDQYKDRERYFAKGQVISFWGVTSFSTADSAIHHTDFMGGPDEPAIIFTCMELKCVDIAALSAQPTEFEVQPLPPSQFRVLAFQPVGAKLIVTVEHLEHEPIAYWTPPNHRPAAGPLPPLSNADASGEQAAASAGKDGASPEPASPPVSTQKNLALSDVGTIIQQLRDTSAYRRPVVSHSAPILRGVTPPRSYWAAAMDLLELDCGSSGQGVSTATAATRSVALWAIARTRDSSADDGHAAAVLPDGSVMTRRELLVEAIRLDAFNSPAYESLAASMPVRGKRSVVKIRRVLMTRLDLCIEALRHDPRLSDAFVTLAGCMLGPEETVTLADRRTLTRCDALLQAIRLDPSNSRAYYELGKATMQSGFTTLPDGSAKTPRELLWEALRLDPTFTQVHLAIAATLRRDNEDDVSPLPDSTTMTPRQIYEGVLERDPLCVDALAGLASTLDSSETVSMPILSADRLTRRVLLLKAVQLDPQKAGLAYFSLAMEAPLRLLDGSTRTQSDLYAAAVGCDVSDAQYWLALATSLTSGQQVIDVPNYGNVDRQLAFIQVIAMLPDRLEGYLGLGQCLVANAICTASVRLLNGKAVTVQSLGHEVLRRAEPRSKESADAFVLLAASIAPRSSMKLKPLCDGTVQSRIGLLIRAIRIAPQHLPAHVHLVETMHACDLVRLQYGGPLLNKKEVLARIDELQRQRDAAHVTQ